MLLGDTVPRFRRDLKIEKKPPGLYEVSDVKADKRFTLYDIELSIARMLDGKRTVQQVIEAGTKIGIPITLESLEKFERQLTAYGFLQQGAEAEEPVNAWAPRDEWPPELREMFRSALSKYRQNRFDEASEYLKAMLAMDSNNKEATEMLAAVAEKRDKAAPPVGLGVPVLVPTEAAPAPKPSAPAPPRASPAAAMRDATRTTGVASPAAGLLPPSPSAPAAPPRASPSAGLRAAPRSAASSAPEAPLPPAPGPNGAAAAAAPVADGTAPVLAAVDPAVAAAAGLPPLETYAPVAEQPAPPPAAPLQLPAWALPAGGGGLVVLLLLVVPLPRNVSASVLLEAPDAVVVKAPRDLQVKSVVAKNAAWVEAGAVLLELDGNDDMGSLKPYDGRVTRLQQQIAQTQRAVSSKQIASWTKTVRKLEGELEHLKAAAAKGDKKSGAAQKKIPDKEREIVEAKAELEDATKADALAKLKSELDEATAAREKAAAEDQVLRAPAAGFVIDLQPAAGQKVASGAPVARIADSHVLTVTCNVQPKDASSLAAGQIINATLKGKPVPLTIDTVDGAKAVGRLQQTGTPELIAGDSGDAKIRVESRSLLGRLFR